MTMWSGGVGGCSMLRLIEPADDVRPSASLTMSGSTLVPGAVSGETFAWTLNVLPAPENTVAAEPPIDDRSAFTLSPLLTGLVPGVTLTDKVVDRPGSTEFGLAVPTPLGLVAVGVGVGDGTGVGLVDGEGKGVGVGVLVVDAIPL